MDIFGLRNVRRHANAEGPKTHPNLISCRAKEGVGESTPIPPNLLLLKDL
jgi:hypothetical protein